MKPSRVLPIPAAIGDIAEDHPVAFEAGALSARAGESEECNPYVRAAERGAWACGWVSQKEGWIELITEPDA